MLLIHFYIPRDSTQACYSIKMCWMDKPMNKWMDAKKKFLVRWKTQEGIFPEDSHADWHSTQ